MGSGVDLHSGGQQHVVAYVYLAHIQDGAVEIGVEILADKDVGAIVAEEGGRDETAFCAATQQAGEALIPVRGIGSLPVQFSQQGAALLPRSPQFGVPCIIGRSRHHLLPLGATHGGPLHCCCVSHHCSISQIRDS